MTNDTLSERMLIARRLARLVRRSERFGKSAEDILCEVMFVAEDLVKQDKREQAKKNFEEITQ